MRVLLWLLRALPSQVRLALFDSLAATAFALGIRRRVTLDNLGHAFPQWTAQRRLDVARAAYRSMGRAVLDGLTSDLIPDAQLESAVRVVDWRGLDQLLASRRPVLIASAHFGSWELFAELMARRGHVFSAVVRPLRGALNQALVQQRLDAGVELIHPRGALKKMLSALARGRAVVQLIDQALPSKQAVWVPFFGRLASTTPAVSMAAWSSKAPVYVVLAERAGSSLSMRVEGPVAMPQLPKAEAIAAHTAALTELIERAIREQPEQWLWLHRRWKGTASGDQIASRSSTPA